MLNTLVSAVQMAAIIDAAPAPLKVEKFAHSPNHPAFTGVQVGEFVVQFQRKANGRSYNSKSRVYGACDELIADLNAVEPTYISSTNENSTDAERVQEKLWLAWRAAGKKVAQKRLTEILTAVNDANLGLYGLDASTVKGMTFSFKAGCSMCPCSPGFILNGRVLLDGWLPVDMFIVSAASLERRS